MQTEILVNLPYEVEYLTAINEQFKINKLELKIPPAGACFTAAKNIASRLRQEKQLKPFFDAYKLSLDKNLEEVSLFVNSKKQLTNEEQQNLDLATKTLDNLAKIVIEYSSLLAKIDAELSDFIVELFTANATPKTHIDFRSSIYDVENKRYMKKEELLPLPMFVVDCIVQEVKKKAEWFICS